MPQVRGPAHNSFNNQEMGMMVGQRNVVRPRLLSSLPLNFFYSQPKFYSYSLVRAHRGGKCGYNQRGSITEHLFSLLPVLLVHLQIV